MHLWLLFPPFSSRLQRNNYNTLGVCVNTALKNESRCWFVPLFSHNTHYFTQTASGQFVSWHHKCFFTAYLILKKAPQGACFENQSAAAAGCDLTRTKQNLTFSFLCLGILCNPCSVHFGAIPSLPELHFDALHQPYDKSIVGAEGNITSVISVFQFHWLWASYRQITLEKDSTQRHIKEAVPSQTASGRPSSKASRRRSNGVVKMPIAERSLSLFSLNDINQHLTSICGISPPQKRVTRESVQ